MRLHIKAAFADSREAIVFRCSEKIALQLLLTGILSGASVKAASVFNFDSDTPGTSTPFADTNAGVSAAFSNNGRPGGFTVDPPGQPGTFQGLSGNVLANPGPVGLDNLVLTIAFAPDISSITLNFALNSDAPAPFMLTAFKNNATVGSVIATDSIPTGFTFPEGVIRFSASDFDSVSLSTSAPDFVIDNIAVSAVAPEPATTLPFLALLFLVAPIIRRNID